MCSKLVVISCVACRRPSGVPTNASACRRDRFHLLSQLPLREQQFQVRPIAVRPSAGGRERHHAGGATTSGKLKRNIAAERVADEVRNLQTSRVHRMLDGIDERLGAHATVKRWTSCVPRQRHRKHVVLAFGSTSSQLRHVSIKPCRHTNGDPDPPR
jgi:hypothetical protein